MNNKLVVIIAAVIIIAAGAIVYSNSINSSFLWDDNGLVKDNLYIRNIDGLKELIAGEISTDDVTFRFYRPMQMITYAVDYALWKLDVRGYHLTNLIFHILTSLLVYFLINLLYKEKLLSFFTAIIFVVHPIHTEAISYISGRSDPMAAVFLLLGLIFYIKCLRQEKVVFFVLSLFSFLLAVLSRETSLIFIVLLLLYHWLFGRKVKFRYFLPFLLVTSVFIFLRLTILKNSFFDEKIFLTTLLERLPGFFAAIYNYFRLLIMPFDLHMEYGLEVFKWYNIQVTGGIAVTLFLVLCLVKDRKKRGLVSFSILWFFITLFPVSNLYPVNAYMAEHWMYIPSIGFFLIAAKGLTFLFKEKKQYAIAGLLLIGLVSFYSYLTVEQNKYWQNPIEFCKKTLKYAPRSWRLYNNLGRLYMLREERHKAIEALKKAIEINPSHSKSYNNIAVAYNDIGETSKAIHMYKMAIKLNPEYAKAYYNLANLYKENKNIEEAIVYYQKAISINNYYAKAYNNLGMAYDEKGDKDKTVYCYKKAIETDKNFSKAYYNLGNIYDEMGEYMQSIYMYKKAIEIDPDFIEAYNAMAMVFYNKMNDLEKAVEVYKRAIENNSKKRDDIYYNLGNLYSKEKDYKEAIVMYEKTVELNPNYAKAYFNLGNAYRRIKMDEKAINEYQKAIEKDPIYAKAYCNLGNVYNSVGRREEAIKLYEEAAKRITGNAILYYNLSVLYFYEKVYERAIKNYDLALKLGYTPNEKYERILMRHRVKEQGANQ